MPYVRTGAPLSNVHVFRIVNDSPVTGSVLSLHFDVSLNEPGPVKVFVATASALVEPVLLLPSVAVIVTVSAVLSFVLIVNEPALKVFVLSSNVPLPSLSN